MIILEEPYVSNVLLKTVERLKIPILKNEKTRKIQENYRLNLMDAGEFKKTYKEDEKLYTNSENALDWIYKNLSNDRKIQTIRMFKNKAEFRTVIKESYPELYYKTLLYNQLSDFDIKKIKLPIILKPNQGFFSLAVYTIYTNEDWARAIKEIKKLVREKANPFNEDVISHSEYIIEEYIKGDEYAVDGYYDEKGSVIILNIFKHIFSSETDVSDRLYITNSKIIETYIEPLEEILNKVNKNSEIKNFPFHFEVRIEEEKIVPIEMNPLRFAGWCTTDIAYYAYGINTYEYFFKNEKPDWATIFKQKKNKSYAMVIMDRTNNSKNEKRKFNYKKLENNYSNILELREVDYKTDSIYGFMFLDISLKQEECYEKILKEDFDRFLD